MSFLKQLLRAVFPTLQLHNSRTVRYAFSFTFFFLFATALGMAAVTTKGGSAVRIVTNQNSVEQGKIFLIEVLVYASQPVNAIDLAVTFPPEQVEIMGIDKGESVITLWTEEPHVEGSAVILRGGTYKKGFIGEKKSLLLEPKQKPLVKQNLLQEM